MGRKFLVYNINGNKDNKINNIDEDKFKLYSEYLKWLLKNNLDIYYNEKIDAVIGSCKIESLDDINFKRLINVNT